MIRIDNLVAKYNTEFVLNAAAVKQAVHRGEVLDFSNKNTLYKLSNRCGQVAQMFQLENNGYISREQNIELQARTKGYAIDKVLAFVERCQSAGVGATVTVDNSVALKAEVEELKALLAAKDTQVAELQNEKRDALRRANRAEEKLEERNKALVSKDQEIDTLKISLRQFLRNQVVTKHASSIVGKVAQVAATKVVINIGK